MQVKNKRKLGYPFSRIHLTSLLCPCLNDLLEKSRYSPCEFVSLEMELDQDREEKVVEPEHAGWDDPFASQLEGLLLANLHFLFQCAHKVISDCGFDEKDAEKAISRAGLYVGDKDPIIKIVNDTLAFLKGGKDVDTAVDIKFEDLEHLTEYTMLEMIYVLQEVRPFLSVVEAMWWLLICDLNVVQACRFEVDSMTDYRSKEVFLEDKYLESICSQLASEAQNHLPEMMKIENFLKHMKSSDPYAPEGPTTEKGSFASMLDNMERCLDTIGERLQTITQTSTSKVKPGVGQKGRSKRDIATLLQKPYHLGRNYKTYVAKGSFKSGKLVIEKRSKYLSELPGINLKIGRSGINAELGGETPSVYGIHPVSTNKASTSLETTGNSSKLPGKGTISSSATEKAKLLDTFLSGEKSDSNSQYSTSNSPVIFDDCAGIPYDKSLEKYIPHDEKDEVIVKLVSRLREVQYQLEGWTKWANQKIMLATCKLTKDQLELKALRQKSEPEQVLPWGKIMKKLSANITKRLSDMDNALNNITVQLENGKSTIDRLEVEKSMLKKDVEVAKSKALESAASYQEALERENKALKEVASWEGQNGLLHQQLETEKNNMAALQQDLGKAKNTLHQIEVCFFEKDMLDYSLEIK